MFTNIIAILAVFLSELMFFCVPHIGTMKTQKDTNSDTQNNPCILGGCI